MYVLPCSPVFKVPNLPFYTPLSLSNEIHAGLLGPLFVLLTDIGTCCQCVLCPSIWPGRPWELLSAQTKYCRLSPPNPSHFQGCTQGLDWQHVYIWTLPLGPTPLGLSQGLWSRENHFPVLRDNTHLDCLLPDGRVGVQEAMCDVGEDLGVDCRLIKVLDELLHLWPRGGHEKTAAPPPQSQGHSGFGCSSADTGHQVAS